MNIKSLLLGSAAAFAVVSGAQAADAIVAAQPEPMEYVKVCDAFGTGYFYIPGTETCLKIGGHVRYDVTYNSAAAGSKWDTRTSESHLRLEVNAKNDSEFGTVYSYMRLQGNSGGTMSDTFYAGIGPFEFGYHDTAWTRFFGYGGFTYTGGRYDFMRNSYVALQGSAGAVSYLASVDDLQATAGKTYGLNAGIKGSFGDLGAALGVAYDGADKSAAVKGYVSGKMDIVSLKLMGLYSNSATNAYVPAKGFTLIAGAKVDVTDKVYIATDYSYSFTPKTWNIVGDLGWNVASGFDVLASIQYDSGTKAKTGFLRFQRSF